MIFIYLYIIFITFRSRAVIKPSVNTWTFGQQPQSLKVLAPLLHHTSRQCLVLMSPSPAPAMSPVPEVTGAGDKRQPQPRSRRSSNVSLGRRSRLSSEVGDTVGEKVQVQFVK